MQLYCKWQHDRFVFLLVHLILCKNAGYAQTYFWFYAVSEALNILYGSSGMLPQDVVEVVIVLSVLIVSVIVGCTTLFIVSTLSVDMKNLRVNA
jgi:hypothetical protein